MLQCDGCPDTSCSKKVVTTTVTAGDLIFARLSIRYGFVPEAGQRIIFGQETKNGCPRANLRDEGGWYSSRSLTRYSEALLLQNIHYQLRRLDFLEREFGELPHFVSDTFDRGCSFLDCLVNELVRLCCHDRYSLLFIVIRPSAPGLPISV